MATRNDTPLAVAKAAVMGDPAARLQSFLSTQAENLYDVVALLDATAERVDAATPSTAESQEGAESMTNTLRLVTMARRRVAAVIDLMESEQAGR